MYVFFVMWSFASNKNTEIKLNKYKTKWWVFGWFAFRLFLYKKKKKSNKINSYVLTVNIFFTRLAAFHFCNKNIHQMVCASFVFFVMTIFLWTKNRINFRIFVENLIWFIILLNSIFETNMNKQNAELKFISLFVVSLYFVNFVFLFFTLIFCILLWLVSIKSNSWHPI